MSQVASPAAAPATRFSWQTPLVILICGCMIGVLGFGARSGLGFFLKPMSTEFGWGRDVLSLALAIQMLLWGAAQPVTGALADRYGPVLVLGSDIVGRLIAVPSEIEVGIVTAFIGAPVLLALVQRSRRGSAV